MSAFEITLARLYTDAAFRHLFLENPEQALSHTDLSDDEKADLKAIDRVGLIMAAGSFSAKRQMRKRKKSRVGWVKMFFIKMMVGMKNQKNQKN